MRKALVLVAVVTMLFATVQVASADSHETPEFSKVWFFGDCQTNGVEDSAAADFSIGCRGFGIFFGEWDNESIAHEIAYEANEEFGGQWQVLKLFALNVFNPAGSTPGENYLCNSESDQAGDTVADPYYHSIGLWLAWFEVAPCDTD